MVRRYGVDDDPVDGEARRFHSHLRELTDDDLDRFRVMVAGYEIDADWADPVYRLHVELICMANNERVRRRCLLGQLEADLQGGHRVEVFMGDGPDTWAAYCDPAPGTDDDFCWTGPDRQTIEEAIADGQAHHPGYKVTVDL